MSPGPPNAWARPARKASAFREPHERANTIARPDTVEENPDATTRKYPLGQQLKPVQQRSAGLMGGAQVRAWVLVGIILCIAFVLLATVLIRTQAPREAPSVVALYHGAAI